jgi:hypothetical protein
VSAQEQTGGAPSLAEEDRGARAGGAAEPTEEQLRAAYEAELSRISSVDMALQAAASLLNIGAYRLGLTGGPERVAGAAGEAQRDLAQVRDAIDAVRGLLGVIERSRPQELPALREALSQLQMAYAREVQAAGAGQSAAAPAAEPAGESGTPTGSPNAPAGAPRQPQEDPGAGEKSGPGPAESSGRLWVPGR